MKWLTLVLSMPTENATARMRAWRALKSCGAAVLRDGVYLLPKQDGNDSRLSAIAQDVRDSVVAPPICYAQRWTRTSRAGIRRFSTVRLTTPN